MAIETTSSMFADASEEIFPYQNVASAVEYASAMNYQQNPSSGDVDQKLKNLDSANIAFNTPASLIVGEEHPVMLLISGRIAEEVLEHNLDSILGLQNYDSIESHRIRASTILEAQLTGQSFSVLSNSPVRQPVGWGNFTRWDWQVNANEPGRRFLILTINALINFQGEERAMTIQTFRREINVAVKERNISGYLNDNKDWFIAIMGFIGTIVGVVLGVVLEKRFNSSRKSKKTK